MELSNPPSQPLSIQLCMLDREKERKREREKGRDNSPIRVFKSSSSSLIDRGVCVWMCGYVIERKRERVKETEQNRDNRKTDS